ncbi:MAG: DUF6265 family protein [Algoriphagus aquaeductus]|jgi:hypothetical protein|uniref:DUF6265 domain-containing protein n=1 Tax=Algoriphagus aquaeductus TaxID=475299 RepID=A0A326RLW2_9BACT|nr:MULTISPECIES: DUF6265 family protein [Algoriphagus]PZV78606.1 hypothetical protein CLV31_11635 [Algoriphagus aquaeductus]
MKALLPIFLFLTISHWSFAQVRQLAPGQNPGKGTVAEFDWLVGYWTGTGLGGDCEEVWMPEVDGHMIGTFRFWENGALVFSEFMNLVQDGESVTMKLKHFGADFLGWEEKEEWTTFELIELGKNKAFLNGMTIERKGDQLIFQVNISEGGEPKIETFTYTKKSL